MAAWRRHGLGPAGGGRHLGLGLGQPCGLIGQPRPRGPGGDARGRPPLSASWSSRCGHVREPVAAAPARPGPRRRPPRRPACSARSPVPASKAATVAGQLGFGRRPPRARRARGRPSASPSSSSSADTRAASASRDDDHIGVGGGIEGLDGATPSFGQRPRRDRGIARPVPGRGSGRRSRSVLAARRRARRRPCRPPRRARRARLRSVASAWPSRSRSVVAVRRRSSSAASSRPIR